MISEGLRNLNSINSSNLPQTQNLCSQLIMSYNAITFIRDKAQFRLENSVVVSLPRRSKVINQGEDKRSQGSYFAINFDTCRLDSIKRPLTCQWSISYDIIFRLKCVTSATPITRPPKSLHYQLQVLTTAHCNQILIPNHRVSAKFSLSKLFGFKIRTAERLSLRLGPLNSYWTPLQLASFR